MLDVTKKRYLLDQHPIYGLVAQLILLQRCILHPHLQNHAHLSCLLIWQGANTPFIMKSRGLSRSVPMSDMLERNPQIKHLMEAGELVPDVSASIHVCT